MKKPNFLPLVFLLNLFLVAQEPAKKLDFFPLSPEAAEILRFDDFPVSNYTGLPKITIPILNVDVNGFNIPLELNYHSGGIKVNQESSMVGLGWSFNLPVIIQSINDEDDYGYLNSGNLVVRKLPDWHGIPIITDYPERFNYPFSDNGPSWSSPWPINSPIKSHVAKIATDFYFPINGDFDVRHHDFVLDGVFQYEDNDPDIFKVNFFGHSLTFLVDVNQYQVKTIKLLDASGYRILRYDDNTLDEHGFIITTPNADSFYFTLKTTNGFQSQTSMGLTHNGSSSLVNETEHIYHLKKIITSKGKAIVFNYSPSIETKSFPTVSEKLYSVKQQGFIQNHNNGLTRVKAGGANYHVGRGGDFEILSRTNSRSIENRSYLEEVVFPDGKIEFTYSNRLDSDNRKLDRIVLYNMHEEDINTFNFQYEYFTSSNLGNQPLDASNYFSDANNTYNYKRLKLNSIDLGDGLQYTFSYDSNNLPPKRSYATDFWGYYNGRLSDVSTIPNPLRYNLNDFTNNGNNKSSRLDYTKACTLKEITYPTGGKTLYEFELNEFSNYWIPDYLNTTNTITHGGGLRVASITKFGNFSEQLLKTDYSYSGGKSALPLIYYSNYNMNWLLTPSPGSTFNVFTGKYVFDVHEFNNVGYYSPNLLGSHSGIGYDEVLVSKINLSNEATIGSTKFEYYNNEDIIGASLVHSGNLLVKMPAFINTNNPNNGLVKKITVNDANNQRVTETFNNYDVKESELYYGTKITSAGIYNATIATANVTIGTVTARTMIGFYPIFGAYSQLSSTISKEYFNQGEKTYTTSYEYNNNNIQTKITTVDASNNIIYEKEMTPYSDLFESSKYINLPTKILLNANGKRTLTEYDYINTNFPKIQSIQSRITGKSQALRTLYFDQYFDDKVIQYHHENGKYTTVIWGYNNSVPIVKIDNMTYGTIYSQLSSEINDLKVKSDLDNDNTIGYVGKEGELRLSQFNFRNNALFSNSMITTYTYDPLVGVTSMTDPKGYTIYYEYDELNRLKHVKDNDGNILSANDYNYKQN